jgi:acetyl-CoA carboxylase biotin carboxyl carrier protein
VSLTAADIAEIARLLDESHFTDLKLETGGLKLRIRRSGGGWAPREEYEDEEEPAEVPSPALEREPMPIGQQEGAPRVGEVDVPAPLLGNFYAAPRPGDPPFVAVGDSVSEDSVVGIIEVMKLMNSVRAGVAGKVVAILAADGSAVAEGQPLVRIRRVGYS